jgi:hypothetical protein
MEQLSCHLKDMNFDIDHFPEICRESSNFLTNKCVDIIVGFIDAFLEFPQHVSANNCHNTDLA